MFDNSRNGSTDWELFVNGSVRIIAGYFTYLLWRRQHLKTQALVALLFCPSFVIRTLRMGSCMSAKSRSPPPGSPSSPSHLIRRRKSSATHLGSRAPLSDLRREEQLHRISGRMFLNGSSEAISLFTQKGKKGTNQDAMIAWENFASPDTIFCGVFDGHGPFGHMVAKKVRDALPLKLSQDLSVNSSGEDVLEERNNNATESVNSEDNTYVSSTEESEVCSDLEGTDAQPEIFKKMKKSFLKAFKVMDKELRKHETLDCSWSGTTAVALVKQGRDIIIGNVGDSRAVLGTRVNGDDSLVAVQLTVDLKPDLPEEAERIRRCKGRVFAFRDEPEVVRVWLPHKNSPGLAMARAFGDFCLKDFGVIAVPKISYRQVHQKDEFIIVATDGIWDVLSNEEAVAIVASVPLRSSAARSLVESAVQAWRYKYPTSKVDDCAVVCLFLNTKQSTLSTASSTEQQNQSASDEQVDVGSEDDDILVPTSLDRSNTIRIGNGTVPEGTQDNDMEDELQLESGTDWSALEGV